MRKYLYIFLAIIVLAVAYLFLTHHYIYYNIGKASLPASDKTHEYMINNNSASTKKIIYAALGDSLTAGVGTDNYEESYPYLLAQDLSKSGAEVDLKVFAYPGARTSDLIKDLLQPAIASQPDVITLLVGTNDMHGFVSAEAFKNNYQYILDQLTQKTKAKIYLISVPFLGSDSTMLPPWNYYFERETIKFNNVIKELAGEYGAEYIDIATPTAELFKASGPQYADDSFHPSAIGYAAWAGIIFKNTEGKDIDNRD